MSRPERAASPALLLVLAALVGGCGKGNLVRVGEGQRAGRPARRARPAPKVSPPAPVAIPLKLTATRAEAFAAAVNLSPVDVPGSHGTPRSPSLESQQEESAECNHGAGQPIGGGRSAKLDRGHELETESISSSVIVMPTAGSALADLAYADSRAGLACYTRLLSHRLAGESSQSIRIGHVSVSRLSVGSSPSLQAHGLRIAAAVSGVKSGITIGLYVDAIAFDYGPAEIELYATSFVQPIATRTENDLLSLMLARAHLARL